jgi:hypothetical protein
LKDKIKDHKNFDKIKEKRNKKKKYQIKITIIPTEKK